MGVAERRVAGEDKRRTWLEGAVCPAQISGCREVWSYWDHGQDTREKKPGVVEHLSESPRVRSKAPRWEKIGLV